MIVKKDNKWYVQSEKGKNLGGPYNSKEEARKRLKQVEYFKHNQFQSLTFNLKTDLVRHDQMEGKDYLVVPMVMMVEGVHKGSAGPLLYPADELAKTPQVWNHKPVIVYHPSKDGVAVSACSPEVLTARKVGLIMNAVYDTKLKAEAWLDPDRIKVVDDRILTAIDKKEMMELSTGVFTDNDVEEGEWNGEKYVAVARNYRPDHLALLPDQKGACSIDDGAGFLRLNKESIDEISIVDDEIHIIENRIDVTEDYIRIRQKEPLLFKDKTIKTITISGSKMIKAVVGKLKNPPKGKSDSMIIQSYLFKKDKWSEGEAKKWVKDHEGIAHNIENYNEDIPSFAQDYFPFLHAVGIDTNKLVFNETGQFALRNALQSVLQEKDREIWIEEIFDDFFVYTKIGKLYKQNYTVDEEGIVDVTGLPEQVYRSVQYKTIKTDKVIMSNFRKDVTMDRKKVVDEIISSGKKAEVDREALMALSEQELTALVTSVDKKKLEEEEEEKKKKEKERLVKLQEEKPENVKPETVEEYIAKAPKGIQDILNSGLAAHKAEKVKLVKVITSNTRNTFTREELEEMGISSLRSLARLAVTEEAVKHQQFNYAGQGDTSEEDVTNQETPLVMPVMNFAVAGKK